MTVTDDLSVAASARLRDKLGVCQWFHFEDRATVRRSVALLRELAERLEQMPGVVVSVKHRDRGRE